MTNASDKWKPEQYEKYKNERSTPFFDLMELLEPVSRPSVIDLGCGSGELTKVLHEKTGASSTLGTDNSPAMLAKSPAFAGNGLTFEESGIENFSANGKYDIVFSNAAIQWCPNHEKLFANLYRALRDGGQLAVQMPMNHDYATHVTARDLATEEPYASALKQSVPKAEMLTAEQYAALAFHLGFREQNVKVQVYGHVLPSREDVVEWVKGTMLTYYESNLPPDLYQKFFNEFKARLFEKLPDDRPFFFPFKRLLLWAKK